MADTLESSLLSVLTQIDSRYEVIFVDDGSNDGSFEVALKLAKTHSALKVYSLERDPNRKLGHTRNLSFQYANGEWCIFHIDCDDEIGPYIQDFVKVVGLLDEVIPNDVLFSGQQIHMAKRSFLLSHGPFNNLYRGEDRDLYFRLVKGEEWIVIRHKRFIKRMSRSRFLLLKKNLHDNFDQMVTDIAENGSARAYLHSLYINRSFISVRMMTFRLLSLLIAKKKAAKRPMLSKSGYPSLEEFLSYRSSHTKTIEEWFHHYNLSSPENISSFLNS